MPVIRLVLAVINLGFCLPAPLEAQQVQRFAVWAPATMATPGQSEHKATVPDSVRRRVGYHHWKGGAIGAGVGALGGLALALDARGRCDDCTSDNAPAGKVTLIGAGLGGAFGFLVGATSPKYRWVPSDAP